MERSCPHSFIRFFLSQLTDITFNLCQTPGCKWHFYAAFEHTAMRCYMTVCRLMFLLYLYIQTGWSRRCSEQLKFCLCMEKIILNISYCFNNYFKFLFGCSHKLAQQLLNRYRNH